MYKYKNLIKRYKHRSGSLAALGDIFLFTFPAVWDCLFDLDTLKSETSIPIQLAAIFLALVYLLYLIKRIFYVYKLNSSQEDAFRQEFIQQLDSVTSNKYQLLCNAIHFSDLDGNYPLVYDAHIVINSMLDHIRQLVANITGVSLNNISVNFIYRYYGENEHWQTINGSSSCSIGELDDIVENKESMYHHIYANNREYVFFNDKASIDWHSYRPSIRDGENKNSWGSIYCKRIMCTLHQERLVDGILSISTYNEKFVTSKRKYELQQTEHLINQAICIFENSIKCELASLYIRHAYIKNRQINILNQLIRTGYIENNNTSNYIVPEKLSEDKRVELIEKELPKFKLQYNEQHPNYFHLDATIDTKTEVALSYETMDSLKNNSL